MKETSIIINFFRRLSKNGLASKSIRKYFLIAIGEITLVMIGILLALQVNKWNENRKSEINKDLLLKKVKQEFQSNFELITLYVIDVA